MFNAGPSPDLMKRKNMGQGNMGRGQMQPMKPPMGGMRPGPDMSGTMPVRPPMDNIGNGAPPLTNMPVPNLAGPSNPDVMAGGMTGIKQPMNNIQMPGVQPWGMRFGGNPMNIGPMQKPPQMPLFQRYNQFNRGMM